MSNEYLKVIETSEYEQVVKPRLNEIAYLIQLNYSIDQIAKKLLISDTSLRNYKDKYPELNDVFLHNLPLLNDKVSKSLYNRALGIKTKESKTIQSETVINGELVTLNRTEIIERDIPADITAIKYWLNNRDPDNWKSDNNTSLAIQNNIINSNNLQLNLNELDNTQLDNEIESLMNIEDADIIDI